MRTSLALSLLILLVLSGCATPSFAQRTLNGSGTAGSRTEDARGVRQVSLAAPGTLVIEVGRVAPLRIEGDENLVRALIVEQDGDELEIRTPRNTNFRPERPLRYRVGVASLDGVSLAGNGRIESDGIRAGTFSVNLAGSGEIVLGSLDARAVELNIAGSGDVTMDGEAEDLDVNIAGSGNANVLDLAVHEAEVNIAGSGDALINVSEHLQASIMGSGDVRYVGNPRIDRSVMGSGDVEPARR